MSQNLSSETITEINSLNFFDHFDEESKNTSETPVPTPNDDTYEKSTSVGREGRPHQPEGVVSSLESGISEQIQESDSESISQQPGHDVGSAIL